MNSLNYIIGLVCCWLMFILFVTGLIYVINWAVIEMVTDWKEIKK